MKRSLLARGLVLLPLLLAMGCDPFLRSVSSAPVSADGEMHRYAFAEDRIELTRGVALAVECRSRWDWGSCEDMKVHTDDPNIATAHLAHLDKYRSGFGRVYDEDRQRSALVLAGRTAGRTRLRITSDDGERTLEVIVKD